MSDEGSKYAGPTEIAGYRWAKSLLGERGNVRSEA